MKVGVFQDISTIRLVIPTSNGVVAKIVAKEHGTPFDGLPTFSKTGEVYLKADKDGNIIQARIYKDRKPVCDFDWDHTHQNANGDKFEKGVVHVQEFMQNSKGAWERQSKKARYMSTKRSNGTENFYES